MISNVLPRRLLLLRLKWKALPSVCKDRLLVSILLLVLTSMPHVMICISIPTLVWRMPIQSLVRAVHWIILQKMINCWIKVLIMVCSRWMGIPVMMLWRSRVGHCITTPSRIILRFHVNLVTIHLFKPYMFRVVMDGGLLDRMGGVTTI